MASATSKDLYIPLQTIYGKPNADGTYTLTALDIKALNDNLYNIAKKIQGRLTLSDMTSDAAAILVTDDSITMEVSNGSESSTITIKNNGISIASVNVTFTGMVTFSALAGSGTTVINGDNITTGTIQGVTVRSYNPSAYTEEVVIDNGEILLGQSAFGGYLKFDGEKVYFGSVLSPLKIASMMNMSIDSVSGTVYIGSSADGSNQVYIGRPGGRVDLYGDVYINGVLQT